jgi:hypothetical protein
VTITLDSAAVASDALLAVVLALVAVRLTLAFVVVAERLAALRFRVAAAFWPLVLGVRRVVALLRCLFAVPVR